MTLRGRTTAIPPEEVEVTAMRSQGAGGRMDGMDGARRVNESAGPRHSAQTSTIDRAMVASTGAVGTLTTPSTVAASVRLCATVKAVMVRTSARRFRTSSVRASK